MFVGIDTHKDTLAVAVCDPAGTLVEWTEVVNEPAGFAELERRLEAMAVVRVGIEGSGHFGRAVAAHLVGVDYDVREVPTSMTSRERSSRPAQGKTDAVDALAIARITAREAGLLQTFPSDYPWQGNKSQQFSQIGNAVPSVMAEAMVTSVLASVSRSEAAA